MTVAQRLKTIRDFYELTQEEFGERLGYGRSHVSMLEQGERRLTDKAANDVCRVYGISHRWLTKGEGDMRGDEQSFIEALTISLGHIDPDEREILTTYLQLPKQTRRAFWDFLRALLDPTDKT